MILRNRRRVNCWHGSLDNGYRQHCRAIIRGIMWATDGVEGVAGLGVVRVIIKSTVGIGMVLTFFGRI